MSRTRAMLLLPPGPEGGSGGAGAGGAGGGLLRVFSSGPLTNAATGTIVASGTSNASGIVGGGGGGFVILASLTQTQAGSISVQGQRIGSGGVRRLGWRWRRRHLGGAGGDVDASGVPSAGAAGAPGYVFESRLDPTALHN